MIRWYALLHDRSTRPSDATEASAQVGMRVGLDKLNGFTVETVFLALNHNHGDGPPLIFESTVFRGDSSESVDCYRYSTWGDAVAGHGRLVARICSGEHMAVREQRRDDACVCVAGRSRMCRAHGDSQ